MAGETAAGSSGLMGLFTSGVGSQGNAGSNSFQSMLGGGGGSQAGGNNQSGTNQALVGHLIEKVVDMKNNSDANMAGKAETIRGLNMAQGFETHMSVSKARKGRDVHIIGTGGK